MGVIILVDWKINQDKFWLQDELEKLEVPTAIFGIPNYSMENRLIRWRKIILWLQYLKLGITGLLKSKKGDVIFCWNFVVGAMTGFFNRSLHTHRKILSVNMIVHNKGVLNNFVRNLVYNYTLKSNEFCLTINSSELVDLYKTKYNLRIKKYAELPDVFMNKYPAVTFDTGNGYIFSGGEAARDWKTLLKVAWMNPDYKFHFIARKQYFPANVAIPENVEIQFDTTEDIFYSLLGKCSLVVLPLHSLAPAGLIVLIRAAMLSRPVIATSTPSIRQYIIHGKTGVLVKIEDPDNLSKEINLLMKSKDLREIYADALKKHITHNFSQDMYSRRVVAILKNNKWI